MIGVVLPHGLPFAIASLIRGYFESGLLEFEKILVGITIQHKLCQHDDVALSTGVGVIACVF